jgi:hypothetical protein
MSREFIEEYLNSFAEFIKDYWHPSGKEYHDNLEYQKFEWEIQERDIYDSYEEDGVKADGKKLIGFNSEFKFKLKFEDKEYKMPYVRLRWEYKEGDDLDVFYNQLFKTLQRNIIFALGDLQLSNILKGEADLNGLVFRIDREEGDPIILKEIVNKYLAKTESYGEENKEYI